MYVCTKESLVSTMYVYVFMYDQTIPLSFIWLFISLSPLSPSVFLYLSISIIYLLHTLFLTFSLSNICSSIYFLSLSLSLILLSLFPENIFPFLWLGFLYMLTNPPLPIAKTLYRYTIAGLRIQIRWFFLDPDPFFSGSRSGSSLEKKTGSGSGLLQEVGPGSG